MPAWYRPPDTPFEKFENFEDCLKKMDAENKEIILIGDYNCNWDPITTVTEVRKPVN